MSYAASKSSTTASIESLVTALCKVSPVMGIPGSKTSQLITSNLSIAEQSLCLLSNYFTSCLRNNNTCGSNSNGGTPLAVPHAVASSEPKSVLCLWHQPFYGMTESKSTTITCTVNPNSLLDPFTILTCKQFHSHL